MEYKDFKAHRIPGQTLIYSILTISHAKTTTVLGFKSVVAAITWLDTEGNLLWFSGFCFILLTLGFGAVADLIGPVVGELVGVDEAALPAWKSTTSHIADAPERLQKMMELVGRQREPRPWAVRNGDLGITKPEKLHPCFSLVMAAFLILNWATTGGGRGERRFSRMKDSTDKACFYGFHADDWFRALYAVRVFHDRRKRSAIDPAVGQYKGMGPLVLCVASVTDTARLVDAPMEDLAEQSSLAAQHVVLANSMRALPANLPAALAEGESFLEMMSRRSDSFIVYTSGLHMSTCISEMNKEAVSANIQRTQRLNERFSSILPLSFAELDLMNKMITRVFPAPKLYVVGGDALEKWKPLLSEGFAETLRATQDMGPEPCSRLTTSTRVSSARGQSRASVGCLHSRPSPSASSTLCPHATWISRAPSTCSGVTSRPCWTGATLG